ncbi:MAG: sugar transferase [Candidatus Paceibacterota bacterium]|nr:sugar transferase [Candidatus Paceibacterota bacterium]MDD4467384.1 sugar transferase [Candidatus Paceibacterota bacterium]
MTKRIFDIIFSLFGIVITFPIWILAVFLIKKDSSGPIFYIAKRIGKGGVPFRMYKFRTMVNNADKIGGPSTAGDDIRLTKTGKFLKRFQIDELPQLINILKGDMSFVGPRPEVKMYVDMMTEEEKNVILSVKPGITDYASLWNFSEWKILSGSMDPERDYLEKIRPKKIRLQIKYVKERNFWIDIKIILKTILKIFQ